MATAKTPAAAKKSPAKKAASTASSEPATKKASPATSTLKPIKDSFTKASLIAHLAQTSATDPKAVKAVLGALESTLLASINKKGLGEFTLPGLLKVTTLAVPAKKKRIGKDPFTGVEREFAAKPATTKIKARALKKLKDAAL